MLERFMTKIDQYAWEERLLSFILVLLIGCLVISVVNVGLKRLLRTNTQPHLRFLLTRLVRYSLVLILGLVTLMTLGIDPNLVLGAAGLISVGAGLAARSTIANVLSGFVLLAETPFKVGDLIEVGEITGEVISVDLMSVRLATLDNLMVRIPNETLGSATIVNLTHFDIRRIDIEMVLPYTQSADETRDALTALALEHPLILNEPSPIIIYDKLGVDGQEITFCAWTKREHFLNARTGLHEELQHQFAQQRLKMPHRAVQMNAGT